MHYINHIALEGSIHEMRLRLAIEQSAMHKVRQAVARWRTEPPPSACIDNCSPLPCQSRWHAEAQCHFMCWLEAGGFAQAEQQESINTADSPAEQAAAERVSAASSCTHCSS